MGHSLLHTPSLPWPIATVAAASRQGYQSSQTSGTAANLKPPAAPRSPKVSRTNSDDINWDISVAQGNTRGNSLGSVCCLLDHQPCLLANSFFRAKAGDVSSQSPTDQMPLHDKPFLIKHG